MIASGRACGHHGAHRRRVEHVEHGRLGAERPELPRLGRRTGGAGDLMAALGQQGNEAGADHAARTHHKDSHDDNSLLSGPAAVPLRGTVRRAVPPGSLPAVTPDRFPVSLLLTREQEET